MKRLILGMSMVAAMLFVSSSAMAAGVNLAWSACLGDGGVANRNSTCLTNTGNNAMVGSFVVDSDILGVTGIEVVIDLITATSPLPDWWAFNIPGTCRQTALTANATISATAANCIDWASGSAAGGLAAYKQGGSIAPADTAAHRRIVIGFATGAQPPPDVLANQEYFGFNAIVSNVKTVGTGACAGCLVPVCIVLNSINVVPGTAAGTKLVTGTVPGSNTITWQGGVGANCAAVPTRNATWGQVKALYH